MIQMVRVNERRVVITGMDAICPIGDSLDSIWQALESGTSGVRAVQSLPSGGYLLKAAAEVPGFTGEIEDFGSLDGPVKKTIRKALKVMCREIQMGVAASQKAIVHAGLTAASYPPERVGVSFGCDYLLSVPQEFNSSIHRCTTEKEFQYGRWASDGLSQMQPLWLLKYLPNMPAAHVGIFNDFRGPNNSITLREASSNLAIGEAYRIIARGHADAMLAGATGTRVHSMKSLHVIQSEELAMQDGPPQSLSRPFDKQRSGMVLGEGAGCIVLEAYETAKARGANILAEVTGFASSAAFTNAGIAARSKALQNSLRMSLRDAGISPNEMSAGELGHIHAHGLSTRSCDAEEASAIQLALGKRAEQVPVVSAKSYFGNLGAASGLVELICSILSLRKQKLFPLLNYQHADPECPIRAATGADSSGQSFVNLNVTPQGQAAAVVVRSLP